LYEEFGDRSKMQIRDYAIPTISDTQVLVKVHAAGLNPVDIKIRNGYIPAWLKSFPVIPGWDVAGTVVQVGEKCQRLQVGDEIYSYCRPAFDMNVDEDCKNEGVDDNGSCAQYIAVKEWKCAKKPKNLSFEEAAAVPLAALTAWQGLFLHCEAKEGDTVLILNASGGVGSFAVQFGKVNGLKVIATCSTKNVEFVRELGADHIIDYTQGDVVGQIRALGVVVDSVYDCVGGENTAFGVEVVKDGGIVTSIASHNIQQLAADAGKVGKGFLVRPSVEELDHIGELLDSGRVKVGKVEAIPLEQAIDAFDKVESGRTVGKIVLTCEV